MRLQQVRDDWTVLGATDPLWAVLVTAEGRHNRWSPADFLATGRTEVEVVIGELDRLGLARARETALDFGCGAGRLTVALAAHFGRVVGVDISAPMLDTARRLDRDGRCDFVENTCPDLGLFAEATFDLVLSSLVMQHLPPPFAETFLAELVRVARPGGAVVVQVTSGADRSARGVISRALPRPVMRLIQRRLLSYPAPMDMFPMSAGTVERIARTGGARVLDAVDEAMYGGQWRYTRYYLARD